MRRLHAALPKVSLPARIEVVSRRPFAIVDAAHTAASARALAAVLARLGRRCHVVLSISADKDAGAILDALKIRESMFLSTKVSTTGREAGVQQIEQSFRNLRTAKIDLVSVHNLRDTHTHLRTLRDLKQAGRIRYIGMTT